jgi:hypothetical protein
LCLFLLLGRVESDITAFLFDCPDDFAFCRRVQVVAGFAKQELQFVGNVSKAAFGNSAQNE